MFQQLGGRGNSGLFHAVEIAVDARVHGAEGHGEGKDAQHHGGAGLLQQVQGNAVRKKEKDCVAGQRKRQRDAQAQCQRAQGGSFFRCGLFRHQLGDGGLITCRSEGKGERQNRAKQLIDAHAFFPEQSGETDAVKKADESGNDAGGGKDEGAHDERVPHCL